MAAEGLDCMSCHVSHAASTQGLLVDKDPTLCLKCHGKDDTRLVKMHRERTENIRRCLGCHDSHVSERPGMIKRIVHDPFNSKNCEACHG